MNRIKPLYSHLAAVSLSSLLIFGGCTSSTNNQADDHSYQGSTGANVPTTAPSEDDNGVIHFAQATAGVLQPGQRVFNSPEEAAAVLKDAVGAKDRRTLVSLFGDEGKALIFSGDRIQENRDMQSASDHMGEYLEVDRTTNGSAVLHMGKENWPFPIPIVKSDQGWFFDVVAGRDELLNRRIGEDELNAIEVCRSYVAAQKEYAAKDRVGDGTRQYAQHILSHPGKKDGLFWEAGPGDEISPMGPLVAEAREEGYPATRSTTEPTAHKSHPFNGYIFHLLTAQGANAPGGQMSYIVNGKMTKGFALVASPSAYGASGIMTFIVGQDGKVYEKNLGEDTRTQVNAMTEYNPDKTWSATKD